MSHVEATTWPQTSTFAFTPRLETTKSAQLATITSCAYLSQKCISCTIKMPGGLQLKEQVEATKPSAKNKSIYYTLTKAKRLTTQRMSRSPKPSAKNKSVFYTLTKVKGLTTQRTSRSHKTLGRKTSVHITL